jgi:hypothetical protein
MVMLSRVLVDSETIQQRRRHFLSDCSIGFKSTSLGAVQFRHKFYRAQDQLVILWPVGSCGILGRPIRNIIARFTPQAVILSPRYSYSATIGTLRSRFPARRPSVSDQRAAVPCPQSAFAPGPHPTPLPLSGQAPGGQRQHGGTTHASAPLRAFPRTRDARGGRRPRPSTPAQSGAEGRPDAQPARPADGTERGRSGPPWPGPNLAPVSRQLDDPSRSESDQIAFRHGRAPPQRTRRESRRPRGPPGVHPGQARRAHRRTRAAHRPGQPAGRRCEGAGGGAGSGT